MLTVREYLTHNGRGPFREWLDGLDVAVRARVQARVFRFETVNLGDHEIVGGVWEARLDFGPGYRPYFGKDGRSLILLLSGGSKGSQSKDIARAQDFWRDYLGAKRHGQTE
jgi:putative addiction module killer protein